MESQITSEVLGAGNVVFEECMDESINLDFTLPDYCPDIQKVLKCQVQPKILSRSLMGDRLNVEGSYTIRVLYVEPQRMTLRCCECTNNFSMLFSLKDAPENAIVLTKPKVDYVNCRATSSRRLDINGAISVCAKIKQKSAQEIVCGILGDAIEERRQTQEVSDLAVLSQQQMGINQTIELQSGQPPVEMVVRTDLKIAQKEVKTLSNKILLEAEATLKMLYISDIESGELENVIFNLPVSEVIPVEGLEEDAEILLDLEVMNHEVDIKTDGAGQQNLVALDLRLMANVEGYQTRSVKVLKDAYSTKYQTKPSYKKVTCRNFKKRISVCDSAKAKVDIDTTNILKIADINAEVISLNSVVQKEKIKFAARANVNILAVNRENEIEYFERMVELHLEHPFDCDQDDITLEVNGVVDPLNVEMLHKGGLEVTFEMKINGMACKNCTFKSLSNLVVDEDAPIEKDEEASLTIYYANAKEDLWDIARRYSTSKEILREENELDSDILTERKMIFITS